MEINLIACPIKKTQHGNFLWHVPHSILVTCLLMLVIYSGALYADNNARFTNTDTKSTSPLNKGTVEYHKSDNITNQIPYFDNRFRIDSELDEITMIFYRKSGSRPVILVRPDGSKIRVNGFDVEKVQWYDDRTFDMIKIKKPMVGPWQAIGDILPESQILVVSDVKIAVEPLPDIIFSGETLKVTGRLFNGEQAIASPHFKEVVKLDVNFYSTNNSAYENFGADAIKITSFRDDGRGLDEYVNDNVFTGEFVMKFSPGEWQPVYLVKLPMATRELRQENILLHKTPITIEVDVSNTPDESHIMNLVIDPTLVDENSLVFQGKITFPDRQIEPFSILEGKGSKRTEDITYTEPGIYRINVSAFGQTRTGREFRLVVPEVTFNVEATDLVPNVLGLDNEGSTSEEEKAQALAEALEQERIAALAAQQQAQKEKKAQTLIILVAGNTLIIVLALAAFLFMRKKKAKS
ncbi:TIGR03503 family protein [Colwellia sp. D2M02]|uniref:TIGR03503 family protein n=1 Tax=Colwellia sp. D2M02 TaxID=2841562 RepID=UPI0020914981|nr:TIGR03503 family protein [Colwellia sp. D2M02]